MSYKFWRELQALAKLGKDYVQILMDSKVGSRQRSSTMHQLQKYTCFLI